MNRRTTVAFAFAVAAVTFIAFLPALHNQFLDWDDRKAFLETTEFRGFGGPQITWMFTTFHMGHYQPVTWLTIAFDWLWGGKAFGEHPANGYGMDPRAYHLTNNIIHAVNAVLIYLLALRLLSWAWTGRPSHRSWTLHGAAVFAAAIFGVHPLRVENVAWVTERRDLVSAFFLLLTVLCYLRAVRPDQPNRWRWIGISCAVFVVSLLAKVSGAPLIVALLVLDWYPLRRLGRAGAGWLTPAARTIWLEKLPFFIAAVTFSAIVTAGQSANQWLYPLHWHSMEARIAQAFYGLVFYLWKTIAPTNLLPLYELRVPLNPTETRFVIAFAIVLAAVVILFLLRSRWPWAMAAALVYAVFLGPVLGFFQNGPQLVADRYSYLASIGIMIALTGGVAWVVCRNGARRGACAAVAIAGCAVVAVLAGLTWKQCGVWRDNASQWSYTVAKDPSSSVANGNYGLVLVRDLGKAEDALPYLRNAVRLDPLSKGARANLRLALRETGRTQELIDAWMDEARFGEYDAKFHAAAGVESLQANDNRIALEHLVVSLALNENQPQTHNNLALVLGRLERLDDAITHYRRAIELDPNLPNPRYGLAVNLARKNRNAEAIAELQNLLKIAPNHEKGREMLKQLQASSP